MQCVRPAAYVRPAACVRPAGCTRYFTNVFSLSTGCYCKELVLADQSAVSWFSWWDESAFRKLCCRASAHTDSSQLRLLLLPCPFSKSSSSLFVVQGWVKALSTQGGIPNSDLYKAMVNRLQSIVSHYKGRVSILCVHARSMRLLLCLGLLSSFRNLLKPVVTNLTNVHRFCRLSTKGSV